MVKRYLNSLLRITKWNLTAKSAEQSETHRLAVIFIALILIVPLIGIVIFGLYSPQIESEAYADLQTIANLKAKQIEYYLNERKADGRLLFENPRFIENIIRVYKGDSGSWKNIEDQLGDIQRSYDYDGIILLNSKGQPIVAFGEHLDAFEETKSLLPVAFLSGQIQMNDLQLEGTGTPYLDFVVPLLAATNGRKEPVGAIVLHVNPNRFLFPYIQSWPTASPSGETLLVRREGNSVLFLNDLRHRRGTALKLKSVAKDLPAYIAINDKKPGIFSGVDYRGIRVLSSYRPVTGTNWFVVAKLDRYEVFRPLRTLLAWVSLISLIVIGIVCTVILLLWRQQKRMNQLELHAQSMKIIQESSQRFWALSRSANYAIITADGDGHILDWNPGAVRLFGYSEAEINGKYFTQLIPKRLRDSHLKELTGLFWGADSQLNGKVIEFAGLRKNGEEFPLELSIAQWKTNEDPYITAIIQDISERKSAEMKIQRLSQLYAALSQCNEAIVRCTTPEELFPKICNDAVRYGGMKMAWIGFIDESTKNIFPVASYGDITAFLQGIGISVDDADPSGQGPTGIALRKGQPVWCQDYQNDATTMKWHERAKIAGFKSSASLPLIRNNLVVGNLTIYSEFTNAFDEDARNLLTEMAMDISFALENFVQREERNQAARILQESEQRFRGLVEQSLAGIYIIQDNKFVYVNTRFAKILGYQSGEELNGLNPLELVVENDRNMVEANMHLLLEKKAPGISYGYTAICKDKTLMEVGVHGAQAIHNGQLAIIGLMQDVTEKKRDEEKIQRYILQLQNVFMRTVEVVNTMSEMRDPYTAGHERRVADIAIAIGKEMGFDERRLEGLKISGWLHDLGKITLPAEMLAKPRKLTQSEYTLVKEHPQTGFDILVHVEFPWPVATVVLQHHERMDGSGYPFGLKNEEILLEARIMAVADVIEAMASHRPYRPGLGIDTALAEIEEGSGKIYDKEVACACLRIFRENIFVLPEF